MGSNHIKSIDDYDDFLRETFARWTSQQRLAMAAAVAERWFPAYASFSNDEEWGDAPSLRRSLDAIWDHLGGQNLKPADINRRVQQARDSTPHMDDFDAPEALAAAVILTDALECCKPGDNTVPAIRAALSGFEGAVPDWDLDAEEQTHLWDQIAVRKELKDQLTLIQQIEDMHSFDSNAVQAFRGSIQPVKLPEKPKAATQPPGISNQTAFEQYRRMVEVDLSDKNRLKPDPDGDPTLFSMLLLGDWMGRYSRRMQTIHGEYGRLADEPAQKALVARQRVVDGRVQGEISWNPGIRQMIDFSLENMKKLKNLDAGSLEESYGYGPSLRRLWLEAKREGKPDREAWQHISAWAHNRPPVWEVEDRRKKKGLAYAQPGLGQHLDRTVQWTSSGDVEFPWIAEVDGQPWQVRLNDFPDEIMYSLLIEGSVVGDFHDWPGSWKRE